MILGIRSAHARNPIVRGNALDLARFHERRSAGYGRAYEVLGSAIQVIEAGASDCNDPAHPARLAALAFVESVDDGGPLTELKVLSDLARATVSAIGSGEPDRALELVDVQAVMLGRHSLHCLDRLCASLRGAAAGSTIADAVAILEDVLAADRRLLLDPTGGGR